MCTNSIILSTTIIIIAPVGEIGESASAYQYVQTVPKFDDIAVSLKLLKLLHQLLK